MPLKHEEMATRIAKFREKIDEHLVDFRIEQNSRELAEFLAAVLPGVIDGFTVLEIGTGQYGGLARFLAFIGCKVTTIDIQAFDTQIRVPGVTYIVLSDPTERRDFERPFDVVFIDGDHTYDGVRNDYDHYKKYGMVIAMHDIAAGRGDGTTGAVRFWREIAYNMFDELDDGFHEIIEDASERVGIGWFRRS